MSSTPRSRLDLLLKLLAIPSVSASGKEDLAARFIYEHLAAWEWFKLHPEYLFWIPTPLEGDPRPLHAVAALVPASRPTKKTVILTGHFDVVDTTVYGHLRDAAFDPQSLARRLADEKLDERVARDLASGKFLFGRGSMDMKAGVAVELELLRDFSENRALFDVNLLLALVPDEENASAGMRGVAPWLAQMQKEFGLEFLAAINAEPTEAGCPNASGPMVFLGTVGKLMPAFLCVGRESHVGDYYAGLNAALLSSRILSLAEGNPDLADAAPGACCPSWICLEQKILREGYSVTVPAEAVLYFNCYATAGTPASVLEQMRGIAARAAAETVTQLRASRDELLKLGMHDASEPHWDVGIFSVDELTARGRERLGEAEFSQLLEKFLSNLEQADPREAGIAVMRELVALSGASGPLIVYGFLPPYYPPRANRPEKPGHAALARAADALIARAATQFGLNIEKTPFFTGLCDLSYFGFQGSEQELSALKSNLPGWDKIYSVPLKSLAELDVPVINFGPSGQDAHKKTERLEKRFSLEEYPQLLEFLIGAIGRENGAAFQGHTD